MADRNAAEKLRGTALTVPRAALPPLGEPLARIHRELKKSFDPSGVFNPGRLYPGL